MNILELIGREQALFGTDISAHKICELCGIDPVAVSDSLCLRASPHLHQNAISCRFVSAGIYKHLDRLAALTMENSK